MDRRISEILSREKIRQADTAEMIASENFASPAVMALCGSEFTNKYAEGYPGKRYYNGCEHMDEIEQLAIDTLCSLYDAPFANVQPHSGANANTAVYQAMLQPGDTILGMGLTHGGHLSHGSPPNISGKLYNAISYGVDNTGWLDYDQIRDLARKHRPRLIIAGASAYPRQISWATFRDIADETGALLMADMAHYSGLVAGNAYESPVPHADVVTSTTHKTLRGPRGGFILWKDPQYTKRINSAIFPGTQGGPLMNIIAAKAQAFIEASDRSFQEYSRMVVDNARTMARVFRQEGMDLVTGGTDSHMLLVDLRNRDVSGRELADALESQGITVNKNGVPGDLRGFVETSGIRLGTAAETTRGRDAEWFERLAQRMVRACAEIR